LTPGFAVLGPIEIRTGGQPICLPRSQRRGMLAFLLINADRLVTIGGLSAAIWGSSAPASARSQIHSTASTIRRHLRDAGSAARLAGRAGGYQLFLAGEDLDLTVFEAHVQKARDDMAEQRWTPAAERLQVALDLWRGDALADASGVFVPAQRLSLNDRRLGAREMLIDCRLKRGEHAQVLPDLRELVRQHPAHERFCAQLMLALHLDGRREEALQQFQRLRTVLAEQQGLDPGSALVMLQKAILLGDDLRTTSDRVEAPLSAPAGLPSGSAAWRPPVPAQLPSEPLDFVGRDVELSTLDRVLSASSGHRTAVIVGGAGVGKTALAVRWAHSRTGHAPDGQLYIDLHGFGPQPPLTPDVALERLLRGLGVPARELPRDVDERSTLYRSMIASRRCIVVLDNARDSEQVRPLLAVGRTTTLVTSRRRLDGLVVHEGPTVITVPALPTGHGRTLLGALTGLDPVHPDAGRLADLCDHLPLALRIAAARLRASPDLSIGDLIAALTDEHQRLRALTVEEGSVAVRAAFRLSYEALSAPAALLFRRLGLVPGPGPSAGAIAALVDLPTADTGALLDELVGMHLVVTHGDRFALHDLLLLYARDLSAEDLPESRAVAERRLLDWYATAAAGGEALLRPNVDRIRPQVREPVRDPVHFTDADSALDWFDAESLNLVAVIMQWTSRHPRGCWQLACNLAGWLERRASLTMWVDVMRAAASAAAADGAPEGEARVLNSLAIAHSHLREPEAALAAYRRARQVRDAMGDRYGAAVVTMNIGCLYSVIGEVSEAVSALQTALESLTTVPDAAVAVRATRLNLAYAYRLAGRYDEALALNAAVLEDAVAVGDEDLACNAHINIGALLRLSGELGPAMHRYRLALSLARDLRNRTYERWALRGLGGVYAEQARYRDAAAHLREAVRLHRDSDDPAADEVQAELDAVRARAAGGTDVSA
jgi:DNA-binding SARP family transcriptional activator/tetratricopeptide (TPR) repeat protein